MIVVRKTNNEKVMKNKSKNNFIIKKIKKIKKNQKPMQRVASNLYWLLLKYYVYSKFPRFPLFK
jgi:hypothetical protein